MWSVADKSLREDKDLSNMTDALELEGGGWAYGGRGTPIYSFIETLVKASINQEQLEAKLLKDVNYLRQKQHIGPIHGYRNGLDLYLENTIPLIRATMPPSTPTTPLRPSWYKIRHLQHESKILIG